MKKVSVICMSFLSVLLIIFTAKFSSKNVAAVDSSSTSNISSGSDVSGQNGIDNTNSEAEANLERLMGAAAIASATDYPTETISTAATASQDISKAAELGDGEVLTTASFYDKNVNLASSISETLETPETTTLANPTIDADIESDLVEIMGRYLRTDIGSTLDMLVIEGGTPSAVIMTNRSSDENLFANLNDGDVIVIKTDGIGDSYPGEADVYNCEKRENGTLDAIDSDKLQSLRDLGFISK